MGNSSCRQSQVLRRWRHARKRQRTLTISQTRRAMPWRFASKKNERNPCVIVAPVCCACMGSSYYLAIMGQGLMCEPSTYLPALEADSSQTLFSDTIQFARSSGTPTVATSSVSEPPKDGFPACKCGKEMFGCSLHPTGRDEWIASQRASLASLTPLLESARDTLMIETSGRNVSESLGKFSPDGFFLKTSRELFQTGSSEPSSVTWPASGMMRDGCVWELTRLVPRTKEKDGSLWPTLTASQRGATTAERNAKRLGGVTLESALAIWESPKNRKNGPGVHGGLNPNFLEWFMGFPIGWTERNLSGTRKSRSRRPSRGKF